MSFRCKNCAWVFNEVTGIKEGEDRPELSQEDMDRQKVEGQVNKVGSLEGLSQEERLAKIRQVLKGIR